jgi:hypothetical protein
MGIHLSAELPVDHDRRIAILICLMAPEVSRKWRFEQPRMIEIIQSSVVEIEDEQR